MVASGPGRPFRILNCRHLGAPRLLGSPEKPGNGLLSSCRGESWFCSRRGRTGTQDMTQAGKSHSLLVSDVTSTCSSALLHPNWAFLPPAPELCFRKGTPTTGLRLSQQVLSAMSTSVLTHSPPRAFGLLRRHSDMPSGDLGPGRGPTGHGDSRQVAVPLGACYLSQKTRGLG